MLKDSAGIHGAVFIGRPIAGDALSHINLPLNDKIFAIQSSIIKKIADGENSAVVVGRCADYVL
ncbi:MAG: cytidylate kinase family protein, partial [Lachnospiraceae bacterium]|nr:cytidylate kinase family protein [Lachnospiraceae bacterium]